MMITTCLTWQDNETRGDVEGKERSACPARYRNGPEVPIPAAASRTRKRKPPCRAQNSTS